MRVYISGASAELDEIESWRDKLHLAGCEVLDDWMACVRANMAKGQTDADLTLAERQRFAANDLYCVAQSDFFWLMVPRASSTGAWLELGFAIGLVGSNQHARRLVVSGNLDRSIFLRWKGLETYESHEAAFEAICR